MTFETARPRARAAPRRQNSQNHQNERAELQAEEDARRPDACASPERTDAEIDALLEEADQIFDQP